MTSVSPYPYRAEGPELGEGRDHPARGAAPGPASPARLGRSKPLFVGSMVAAGTLYTGLVNPNTSHAFPLCPLKLFTGIDCPACGCLRAVHSLTRADVVGAADHNLLFTLAVPFAVVGWFLWLGRSQGWLSGARRPVLPTWVMYAGMAVVATFTVTRNLPVDGLSWLNST